jgi:aspartate aminotransferase
MYNERAFLLGQSGCEIRELAAYGSARAAIVGPEKVYDFTIGNPSVPTPQEVTDTVRELMDTLSAVQLHSYTGANGEYDTRKAVAEDLNRRYGVELTPEEVFIGCGASQELCAVFWALTRPKGEIVAIAPYFPEYMPFVEQTGAAFRVVPADIPDFQIDFAALEQTLNENTCAVIINSPNNPAGTVYSRQTIEKLAALLTRKSEEYGKPIYIVSDEPYRELVYDGAAVPYIPAIYPYTVVCYSYSKSLSLPGERIGYILVPETNPEAKGLYTAVAGASRALGHICAPSLWQKVIARCAHLRPDLSVYDQNRKTLYEGLTAMGYEVAKPQGAFYLFVKAPGGDAKAFMEKAKEKDVLIVPGDGFGCPGYFRMCYCVKHKMILDSLPLLKQLIKE